MNKRIINSARPILIIAPDKTEINRFSLLLSNQGYPVKYCQDLESSLVLFQSQHFELVLISSDKKGRCITEIATALKRRISAMKIVALCGFAQRAIMKDAITSGAVDEVALKTLDDTDFLSVIASLVGNQADPGKSTRNVISRKPVRSVLSHPDNSLLHDLEKKHPGILAGNWSESDSFVA